MPRVLVNCDTPQGKQLTNTGFGSDSSLYSSGTHVLNFSWLDRWDMVVHIDYLNKVPPEDRKVIAEAFDHYVGSLATHRTRSPEAWLATENSGVERPNSW